MSASLQQIQAFFASAVQQPVEVASQPGGPAGAPGLATGNDRLSPADQLEIYREQFWLRHVGALEEDFVTIVRLLGHDAFHLLVERYLAVHPCTAFSLRDLGANLPRFVTETDPYRDDLLLADCARLEWAFVEAFDAPDVEPIAPDAIAAIEEDAWAGARVALHPGLQLVSLAHPAHVFRAAVRAGEEPARPTPQRVSVAVYRGLETLQYCEIDPLAYELLTRLSEGTPLGPACEAVAVGATSGNAEAELEEAVGRWFQFWTAARWVTGLSC